MTELERFLKKVRHLDNGCWEWCGQRSDGYGIMRREDGSRVAAHIWAYEQYIGPRPADSIRQPGKAIGLLVADHICHTEPCPGGLLCMHRRCVNPHHLQWVPQAVSAARSSRTWSPTCRNGHRWTEETTRILSSGKRQCIPCQNQRSLDSYHRTHPNTVERRFLI